jgi:N-acetylmuramoyl-L-alanine amidase
LVDGLNEAMDSIIILKGMLIQKNNENDILRRQLNELKRKISGCEKDNQLEEAEKDQTKFYSDNSELTINSDASNTDLKIKSHEIVYKVQIISSGTRLTKDSQHFKGLNDVWEYKHNGLYKYTVGNELDLRSASELQSVIRKKGFSEAFVVAFKNGKRIPLREAVSLD